MKKTFILSFFLLATLVASAQEETTNTLSIQAVLDACIAMRDAAAANDTAALRQSASDLKALNTSDFAALRLQDGSKAQPSLRGHLVFCEEFADSLADGKDAYSKADPISAIRSIRGQTPDGSTFTKTCFAKAGKSVKYTFYSKGLQELAVVAEAGGLLTMQIHVTNSAGLNERHDDTKAVKQGLPFRKTSFTLPTDRRNTVELEVYNRSKKDCSFVVISN